MAKFVVTLIFVQPMASLKAGRCLVYYEASQMFRGDPVIILTLTTKSGKEFIHLPALIKNI